MQAQKEPQSADQRISFLDFVTDRELRESLASDYRELVSSSSCGNWKCVHVLAGSIIEALLTDYLLSERKAPEEKVLCKGFGDLIKECSGSLLSDSTTKLCEVLKEYRNLIHQGRAKRLSQKADEEGAKIAEALVRKVAGEIAEIRRQSYGFTAEQVVNKILNDPDTAEIVLPSLIRNVNGAELERLLSGYLETELLTFWFTPREFDEYERVRRAFRACYRLIFEAGSEQSKEEAVSKFATTLRTAPSGVRRAIEVTFFDADDLAFASPSDREMILRHMLNEVKTRFWELAEQLSGLGKYVGHADVEHAARFTANMVMYHHNTKQSNEVYLWTSRFLTDIPADIRQKVSNSIQVRLWGQIDPKPLSVADLLRKIHEYVDQEIPF